MNTQKQALLIVALMFLLVGSCAAYAAIDLPYRTGLQEDYQFEESVHRGALLFANNCRTCHGNTGEGFVGPTLNREDFRNQDPLVLAANRHLIERTLICGRAGTQMPAWLNTNGGSLNVRQLEHIVDFLTAPTDEAVLEEEGLANEGWVNALEFAHNLNHEVTLLVTGDTLVSIARVHEIGLTELASLNGASLDSVDQRLTKGDSIKLPANGARGATEHKVKVDNETLRKVNDVEFVGAAMLAELNGLSYEIADGAIHLLDGQGARLPGLSTAQLLALPDGAAFQVAVGQTLQEVADLHGLSSDAIRALNRDVLGAFGDEDSLLEPPATTDEPQPTLTLTLPKVDAYVTRGQTFAEAASVWGNVTGASLASANELAADAVLFVGQALRLPADAYGGVPPETPNPGTACVQYAVPNAVFESIFGPPPVVEFEGTVVAKGTLFVHTQITLPPATQVTITLDNQDEGTLHNIVFFEGPEPGSPAPIIGGCTAGCEAPPDGPADAVRTPWETGLAQSAFTFTTPDVGTYSYLCEIHPTTMRGTLTIEEGAVVPGAN